MDDPDEAGSDEGVLRPEELGLDDAREVERIDENRYLVATDEEAPDPEGPVEPPVAGPAPEEPEGTATPGTDEGEPEPPLATVPERYAVQITAKTEQGVGSTRVASDNIVEVFGDLLRWYGTRVDDSTPPEEVVEILLAEAGYDV